MLTLLTDQLAEASSVKSTSPERTAKKRSIEEAEEQENGTSNHSTSSTPPLPEQQQQQQQSVQPQPRRQRRARKAPHELLTEAEKKANHIASEQKRRQNIRLGFEQLIEVVPSLSQGNRSEALILQKCNYRFWQKQPLRMLTFAIPFSSGRAYPTSYQDQERS